MSDGPSTMGRLALQTAIGAPLWFGFLVIFHGYEVAHFWRAPLIAAVVSALELAGEALMRRRRRRRA